MGIKKLVKLIIKALALALALAALVLMIVKGEGTVSVIKIIAISLVCTTIVSFDIDKK